jgi:DNA-binding MarR family transcriptional regulator
MMTDNLENRLLALLRHLGSLPLLHVPNDIGLTPPAIAHLAWVSRSPGCGVLDIAKGLNLSPPTVSVAINRLVKEGWLERRNDPNDLRARPIFLTPRGETMMTTVRQRRSEMLRFFLSGLTADEQEQLLNLLERAVTEMERKLKEKDSVK